MADETTAVSPLRRRMIDDMTLRNLSPATQRSHLHAVRKFSRYFACSPDRLGLEDVRAFQVYLVSQNISWPALNQTVCALRFFYGVTLNRAEIPERIAYARTPRRLPTILSADEVVRFQEAVASLKARTALTTAYAAGLRASEAVILFRTAAETLRIIAADGAGREIPSLGSQSTRQDSRTGAAAPAIRLPSGSAGILHRARYADDFVLMVQGSREDSQAERQALAQFLSEELRMELSMEKTKITDVRDGFDFLGYRVSQEKMSSTGRHVGMIFIPKGKSQLLRDKIKARVRGTPTGFTLTALIDDLNPVVVDWRNYYRYASRSGKEFGKLDWWLHWRLKSWLGKKHGKASGRTLRHKYSGSGAGESGRWASGGKKLARFSDTKRLRYPDRGLRIPNGWNNPDESFRKGADKFWEATRALAKL